MPTMKIAEAAEVLSITRDAVRKRIHRGTLEAEKVDGEWLVTLPDSGQDAGGTVKDNGQDAGKTERDTLVAYLQAENERLWRELNTRTEEIHRRDVIIQNFQRQLPAYTETRPGLWERIGKWVKGE